MGSNDFDVSSLRIASPCEMPWRQMQGDDKVRFCSACKLNVYNVAAMTRDEVAELTQNGEKGACIRMYRRADGTVLTRDCPIGKRVRDRIVLAASTAAAALVAAAAAIFAYPSELGALLFGAPACVVSPEESGPNARATRKRGGFEEKRMTTGFGTHRETGQ